MTYKNLIKVLITCFLLVFLMTQVSAYTVQIPVCNASISTSCVNITYVGAITNAPRAIMYLGSDGNLYLTNDTTIQYTIVNNYTSPTYYNITNITTQNVTNYYSYNLTNGSNLTIIQNFTANDSIIQAWVNNLNLSNVAVLTMFNRTYYTKIDSNSIFASKNDLTALQNVLTSYATKGEINNLDIKYTPLLAGPNGTVANYTALVEKIENNSGGFSLTWKIILIINGILTLLLLIMVVKNMMGE